MAQHKMAEQFSVVYVATIPFIFSEDFGSKMKIR